MQIKILLDNPGDSDQDSGEEVVRGGYNFEGKANNRIESVMTPNVLV